jgi:hypothetical protein
MDNWMDNSCRTPTTAESRRGAHDRRQLQTKPLRRRRRIVGHVEEMAEVAHEHLTTVIKHRP